MIQVISTVNRALKKVFCDQISRSGHDSCFQRGHNMDTPQAGILADIPPFSRYLTFSLQETDELQNCLQEVAKLVDGENLVFGLGQSVLDGLGSTIPGMRILPASSTSGIEIPSTPQALWCWFRGNDRGEIYHQSRLICSLLSPAFALVDSTDSFTFDRNRDLSGYEDGTENPQGEDALNAAIVQQQGSGLNGSSFVAVQKWQHNFTAWDNMSTQQQDDSIGRHVSDNDEFDEAPESAHVKRTAQESFKPEAFILRRSMPWVDGMSGGLIFVAFGHSFDAFEAILNRMNGNEDGVPDALFSFTRPLNGCYFWCPPMHNGELNLSALGL